MKNTPAPTKTISIPTSDGNTVTLVRYWCNSLQAYVSVPENENEDEE